MLHLPTVSVDMHIEPSDMGRLLKKGMPLKQVMLAVSGFFVSTPDPHPGVTGIIYSVTDKDWKWNGKEYKKGHYLTMPITLLRREASRSYYEVSLGSIEEWFESR